jgi:hypothetical protein
MVPATQFFVARGGTGNEKTSFNPFPGKAGIEHQNNFETLRAGDIHYNTNSFCKKM